MKEHWQERLSKIEDLDERRLLRDVLLAAFSNIEHYTDGQLEAIKQRVFEESKPDHDQFNIYTSVVSVDDYDPINDFLFPMNDEDLAELPMDATVITETVVAGETPTLGKLYFELDYLELLEIKRTLPNRKFKGQLKTSRVIHEIEISLLPYEGYVKQIEKLYELYLANDVPWRTVFHPSIYKFLEIQLETEIEFKKNEKIQEIIIDLEELDANKQINQIPLWNIKIEPFTNQGFPMPAGDRIHYEHVLVFKEEERELGYLIDSDSEVDGIIHTRRLSDRLTLTSSKDVISKWRLWMVVSPLDADLDFPNLTSNQKVESFIDNFSSRTERVIRTTGEIHRLASLFVDIDQLKLVNIEIITQDGATYETYPINPFMKDEVRVDGDKRIMKLKFMTNEITPFTRDMMSFLTSEIAMHVPEFRCVGELV